jgi:DNA polymerase-3 subunit alpha
MKRFEPHCHTEYSNIRLLDAINKPEDLIDRAIELGLAGIAITDHECLAGHIKANKYAKEIQKEHPDFKVALGNEIYLVNERENGVNYFHFILIAKDKEGHKQLRQLSSLAWLNSYYDRGMERVPTLKEDLRKIVKENPGHLIATTACMGGELSTLALAMYNARQIGDDATANVCKSNIISFMQDMLDIFGKDFYIECAPATSKEQIIVNNHLLNIATSFGVEMIIGSDAHYLKKEDRYVHKAYLNSKGGEREVDAFYEFSYLQEEKEIIEHLSKSFNKETIIDLFHNSLEIYNKIENYSLEHKQTIPKVDVKNYIPIPGARVATDGSLKYPTLNIMMSSDNKIERYWVNECLNKLKKLNKYNDIYLTRLEEEAKVKWIIGKKLETNMFAYPITLQHYIDMFWECGSLVGAGRGSSCSGLNHYLLGITQLDPIEWNLPFWRYLNEERTELGDIDLDLCPSKRPLILQKIKEERGYNFNKDINEISRKNLGCTLIATFGTEGTRSTILTACRGYRTKDYPDGIDVDTAQYLTALVPSERGFLWTLDDIMYGNAEKGRKPVTPFINEVEQYPGLLDIMKGISGLINKRSSHASGVILFDEDPYEFGCFMRTPKGEVITQYDLHDAEAAGMTKYDFLVTEVEDKLRETISLLQEYGEIEKDLSLREVYDKYFHPNVLPLDKIECWKALEQGSVINIFQFDSDVGSQAAKKIKPTSILEMSDANGLMRLMTAEKGQETPMEKYVRFKNNIDLWRDEMRREGLTKEEQKILEPYFLQSYGVPPSQEQMMMMLMDKDICGFSLAEANAARKIVGKKQMSKIPELQQKVYDMATSEAMGKYIWTYGIGPQMGYSFSIIHALAYSFIGYQTIYIATNWNPIYWNTACLIVNSGSLEDGEYEYEEDENGEAVKRTEKGTDYAKNAKAIGDMISKGIKVSLVDINHSNYSFEPDIENNQILFGMKALSNVSSDIIEKIEKGRPYASLKDFMLRCPLTKTVMINLIKAGAFDEIEKNGFGDRRNIMAYYISQVCEPKNRLTLQNFNGLIQRGLIPKDLEMQVRVYNFTKYLKTRKVGKYYTFDNACISFFNKFYSEQSDKLEVINGITCILQDRWDKIYQKEMDIAREWLKANQEEILKTYNTILFKEMWDKYAAGTTSKWEMDSLCFYHGEHELVNVNTYKYGIVDFFSLPSEPEIDYFFKKGGNKIPIYKLHRIIGTVIGKNDNKSTVTLLTTTGVTTVKFSREYYAMFKKQISQIGEDGKKHVVEKSWFTRGTMIVVTGYRRDDMFIGKTYAATEGHQLYKITEVVGGDIKLQHERWTAQDAFEEDYDE